MSQFRHVVAQAHCWHTCHAPCHQVVAQACIFVSTISRCCQGHQFTYMLCARATTWWHGQICSCAYHRSSPLCVHTYCFPAPTLAAWVLRSECGMYPRARMLWHRITTFQHHHLVTKAHQLARLQCPAMLFCRVVVWPLLFAHLLCPSSLVAQACLFTQGLCCVEVCGTPTMSHLVVCVCPLV